MSSRFVSGGAIDASTGEAVVGEIAPAPAPPGAAKATTGQNQDEWDRVQKELDAERKKREENRAKAASGEERSLYDILEANKAAKQAAFEEQNRIKNQFRSLDDDEIDFLDEVRESARLEDERVKRETEEGLRAFREAQKIKEAASTADGEADRAGDAGATEEWGVGRKRKRHREREVKGVKRRTSDVRGEDGGNGLAEKARTQEAAKKEAAKPSSASPPLKGKLSLVAYGSDDDDDD